MTHQSAWVSFLAGLALAGTIGAAVVLAHDPAPAVISGPARVIDGDTIVVAGVHVRLWGIDAPEADQTCLDASWRSWACGEAATHLLRDALEGATVECRRKDTDRYGRTVGQCSWHRTVLPEAGRDDMGRMMVENGYAVDYPKYSKGYYAADQLGAKHWLRGIWSGTFDMPWDWRRAHPDPRHWQGSYR